MSEESAFIIHKKDSDTSSVWSHYLTSKDGSSAQCKKCSAVLKTLGGSTKGLHVHLSSKHGIKVIKEVNLSATSHGHKKITSTRPPTKSKIEDYFSTTKRDSLDLILVRMTVLDGLTFNVFITSNDLRKLVITNTVIYLHQQHQFESV